MSCVTRCILRWGLIGGLALGGLTLLVGPQRMAVGLSCVRAKVQILVDQVVDDPAALRAQLVKLGNEYPDRIAEVRGELAQVERELGEIERDIEISSRVVAMTTEDLGELRHLVTRATEASDGSRVVQIRFEGMRYSVDQALNEAHRINQVRVGYQDRLSYNQEQLTFLHEQAVRLGEILDTLETEYTMFQNQLWQIDREIEAIERNDRLIELTERQQETLQSYDRYERVGNLQQIHSKLAQLRTEQEAQLEMLRERGIHREYEQQAVWEIETADVEETTFDEAFDGIEGKTDETDISDSVAWGGPVIIQLDN